MTYYIFLLFTLSVIMQNYSSIGACDISEYNFWLPLKSPIMFIKKLMSLLKIYEFSKYIPITFIS